MPGSRQSPSRAIENAPHPALHAVDGPGDAGQFGTVFGKRRQLTRHGGVGILGRKSLAGPVPELCDRLRQDPSDFRLVRALAQQGSQGDNEADRNEGQQRQHQGQRAQPGRRRRQIQNPLQALGSGPAAIEPARR